MGRPKAAAISQRGLKPSAAIPAVSMPALRQIHKRQLMSSSRALRKQEAATLRDHVDTRPATNCPPLRSWLMTSAVSAWTSWWTYRRQALTSPEFLSELHASGATQRPLGRTTERIHLQGLYGMDAGTRRPARPDPPGQANTERRRRKFKRQVPGGMTHRELARVIGPGT